LDIGETVVNIEEFKDSLLDSKPDGWEVIKIGEWSNQSNLSESLIASFHIRLPPQEEQRKIAEIMDTIDEAIAHTTTLIAKLKQMKAGLLHDLLTGKVRVKI
jgi:type I restriction enzyme, S subunit